MRYRILSSKPLIVTKPNGELLQKEVILYYDTVCGTIGILYTGEGALQNYAFDVMYADVEELLREGVPADMLPALQDGKVS